MSDNDNKRVRKRPSARLPPGHNLRVPFLFALVCSRDVEVIKLLSTCTPSPLLEDLAFTPSPEEFAMEGVYHVLGRMEPREATRLLRGLGGCFWRLHPGKMCQAPYSSVYEVAYETTLCYDSVNPCLDYFNALKGIFGPSLPGYRLGAPVP